MRPALSVERAARIAGLHSFETPTLEGVERRRLQLWILTLLMLLSAALALALVALWREVLPPGWLTPRVAQLGLLGLVILFCFYALEKEFQLRRLSALLVDEKVLTAALTNRLREVNTLLDASKAINLDLDLGQVLDTILACALDLLGGHDASIMLSQAEQELRTVAVRGESGAGGARVRLGEGIAGRVAASREPLLIDGKVDQDSAVPAAGKSNPPASAMCVPLLHREHLFGVLNVNARFDRNYSEYDLRALALFGEQAAAAIANAQLYEEQRLMASRSSYRSLHDPLTRLPNRVLFLDRVEHTLARRRRDDELACLLFLDLNDFKRINDSLGHRAGDEVLSGVAGRLSSCLRSGDTVARFGGDEFAVLVDGVASYAEATAAAERVTAALAAPFRVGGREVQLRACIGISLEGTGGREAEELQRNADTALHLAKAKGKGVTVVFEPEMHVDVLRRLDLETELRRAVARDELEVYYQPIVSLASGEAVAVEALLRWNHPERGLLTAASFIRAAEQAGLLNAIDLWTLKRACAAVKSVNASLPAGAGLAAHVNLLPTRLQDAEIVERVSATLVETDLRAEQLVLEVTEGAVLGEVEAGAARLEELRSLGVRIALDDFGTGYSSLSHLRQFPVSVVKIERQFIRGLEERSEEVALVQAILRFAAGLSLEVVAEGVERESQVKALLDLGCRLGQGFFLAEPLPFDRLVDFLGKRSGEASPR